MPNNKRDNSLFEKWYSYSSSESMTMNLYVEVKLSLQIALLGAIYKNTRAVIFSIEGKNVHINFYFDGPISDENIESSSIVITEIISDFDESIEITHKCIRLDYPNLINYKGTWVYERYEPPIPMI